MNGSSHMFSIVQKYSYYQYHYKLYSSHAFLWLLLDLYRDLDRCSNQGIENYGVSMTTLNEVFLKLEGKSAIDESGKKKKRRRNFHFVCLWNSLSWKYILNDEVLCFWRCSDSVRSWENLEQRRDVFLSLSSLFVQCWHPLLNSLFSTMHFTKSVEYSSV